MVVPPWGLQSPQLCTAFWLGFYVLFIYLFFIVCYFFKSGLTVVLGLKVCSQHDLAFTTSHEFPSVEQASNPITELLDTLVIVMPQLHQRACCFCCCFGFVGCIFVCVFVVCAVCMCMLWRQRKVSSVLLYSSALFPWDIVSHWIWSSPFLLEIKPRSSFLYSKDSYSLSHLPSPCLWKKKLWLAPKKV